MRSIVSRLLRMLRFCFPTSGAAGIHAARLPRPRRRVPAWHRSAAHRKKCNLVCAGLNRFSFQAESHTSYAGHEDRAAEAAYNTTLTFTGEYDQYNCTASHHACFRIPGFGSPCLPYLLALQSQVPHAISNRHLEKCIEGVELWI